jgi:glycosyltransferase involved in cell wall biosynthesis
LSQNYPNLEFLILDGGSTDNSVEIIRKYEDKITFWRSHKDKGQSDAIIEGFNRSTGEIIAWLNSDDRYEPGTLHLIANTFENNRNAIFVYGDYNMVRQDGTKVLKRKVSCDFNVMAYAYLMISQPSAFWKKSVYDEVGGLDLKLHYTMDYDLFLRMAKLYPADRFIHLKKPLSAFRLHPESKSVKQMSAFSYEFRLVKDRHTPPRKEWQKPFLRYFYLFKVEWMYLVERGYLPLRKDNTKA